jgi:very-short-patch-repair endonuclease
VFSLTGHIKIICPFHGIFEQQPLHHLNGSGCPICKTSKGEKLIKKLLDGINIKYDYQKRFKNCKNTKPIPFDFYLPDYNICIEYDGIQHFKPISIFGGKKSLENQKIKDKIKNVYCEKNNIKLIRIKYTDDINYILNNLFENICIIKN